MDTRNVGVLHFGIVRVLHVWAEAVSVTHSGHASSKCDVVQIPRPRCWQGVPQEVDSKPQVQKHVSQSIVLTHSLDGTEDFTSDSVAANSIQSGPTTNVSEQMQHSRAVDSGVHSEGGCGVSHACGPVSGALLHATLMAER